jgi:hypothetical protein
MSGLGAQDGSSRDSGGLFSTEFSRATTAGAVLGIAILAGIGALSYQAGKAMAPSGSDKFTWGVVGVPVGLFTGAIGLGVMGLVANQRKG